MLSSRRVTIVIDGNVDKKLRTLQAKKITETNGTYSYSRVVNETLKKVLK